MMTFKLGDDGKHKQQSWKAECEALVNGENGAFGNIELWAYGETEGEASENLKSQMLLGFKVLRDSLLTMMTKENLIPTIGTVISELSTALESALPYLEGEGTDAEIEAAKTALEKAKAYKVSDPDA